MSRRHAYTLFELLVVLALLVLIVSLGWPSMRRAVARGRLDAAARELQAELGRTRLESMREATPYVFRYQPGCRFYEILPKEMLDRESQALGATVLGTDALDLPSDESPDLMRVEIPPVEQEAGTLAQVATAGGTFYRKTLPETVLFPAVPRALQAGLGEATVLGTSPDAGLRNTVIWSEPILFYPNGRISEATITLMTADNYRYTATLNIRGLTGSITVAR